MAAKDRILIVDDEYANVFLLQTLLKDSYDITSCASGEESLQLDRDFAPDLILLDIMMPGMSGLDVCHSLAQDKVLASIPVIIISAKDDEQDVKAGLEVGALDYVKKPFSEVELLARVKSALQLRHQIRRLREANEEKRALIEKLEGALSRVHRLEGLLPICSYCKKIRNDQGYWSNVEEYLSEFSGAEFTHGICPDCLEKFNQQYFTDQDDTRSPESGESAQQKPEQA